MQWIELEPHKTSKPSLSKVNTYITRKRSRSCSPLMQQPGSHTSSPRSWPQSSYLATSRHGASSVDRDYKLLDAMTELGQIETHLLIHAKDQRSNLIKVLRQSSCLLCRRRCRCWESSLRCRRTDCRRTTFIDDGRRRRYGHSSVHRRPSWRKLPADWRSRRHHRRRLGYGSRICDIRVQLCCQT